MRYRLIALLGFCPALTFAQQGAWESPPFDFGPSFNDRIVAVNLIHVFNGSAGKVVALSYDSCNYPRLWTPPALGSPGAGVFEEISTCFRQLLFCGGHSALSDGRFLHAGGVGFPNNSPLANLFEPRLPVLPPGPPSNQWNNPVTPPDMAAGRWYPTCTTLPDGRVLVTSGWLNNNVPIWVTIPEIYDPVTNTWGQVISAQRQQTLYPNMFVLPDGNVLEAAPWPYESRILSTSFWIWGAPLPDPTWPVPPPPAPGEPAAAVMYEPGKVMRCGGRDPAVATTFVVDANEGTPSDPAKWMVAGSMNYARRNHNLVILPDGKVVAVGGQVNGNGFHPDFNPNPQPVFQAEIFDPAAGTWSPQPASDPSQWRIYHSTAILLRDGRVVSAGGNNFPTAQIFRPPYISVGVWRPKIIVAPSHMQYNQSYTIQYDRNDADEAKQACLIRLASTTHGFDMDQRRVPLEITAWGQGTPPLYHITVGAPLDANVAPPGYYMLFILSQYAANQYAPCELAAYVQVGP